MNDELKGALDGCEGHVGVVAGGSGKKVTSYWYKREDFGALGERVVHYACIYTPRSRGCPTLPNGDPGWPGEPPEVEILEAWLMYGCTPYNILPLLTDEALEQAKDWLVGLLEGEEL